MDDAIGKKSRKVSRKLYGSDVPNWSSKDIDLQESAEALAEKHLSEVRETVKKWIRRRESSKE
jgi:hypothetical protein